MNHPWWTLPGPAGFLSDIIDNMRGGINVAVCMPEHSPADILLTFRNSLYDSELLSFETVDLSDEKDADPLTLLFSRFISIHRRRPSVTCDDLCREDAFAGRMLWLEGVHPKAWPRWKSFLEDYAHACRSHSLLQRTKICVLLKGELALQPPQEDVCMTNLYWKNRVSWLDIVLYASTILPGQSIPDPIRTTVICICAKLAFWDPEVIDAFALDGNPKRVFHPHHVLEDMARSRGWSEGGQVETMPCWQKGSLDAVGGDLQVHSALLASIGHGRSINNRIWSAQVGVLLPFVEERRMELVDALAPILKVPFRTRFGETISDVRDLEVGHIEQQIISSDVQLDWGIVALVRKLREIRNALAHGEPIELSMLQSEPLMEYRKIMKPFMVGRSSLEL